MKWVECIDIINWADRVECSAILPLLIRKLIRASSKSINDIRFPSGKNIYLSGWDGILEVSKESEFIPLGISLWELGSNKDFNSKAERDYEKRTREPLGYNPSNSTYIFITPRIWTKKKEWVEEKKQDRIWKSIIVYDAVDLENWFDIAPTVAVWFSVDQLRKYPCSGIQPSDMFLDEWSTGPQINLSPDILLGGREKNVKELLSYTNNSKLIAVQGKSREEALAFIIACFKNKSELEEDFFTRSLIVDDPQSFRQLSVHEKPLILIPRFEETNLLQYAVTKGHCVIVPIGADSSGIWNDKISLTRISRDSFIESLVKSGLSKEISEKYVKESVRNITILRRQLGFDKSLPKWSKPEFVRDIIPALIIGRWNENFEKDINIVVEISGTSYEEYSAKLKRWLFTEDSPIVQINSNWRLSSPLDTWTNAARFLTKDDFKKLSSSFLQIMNEIDPKFELKPEDRQMASIHGKNKPYSDWIREGLTQSLILISIYGEELKLDTPIYSVKWVDYIISKLLENDNPIFWKSIQQELPLIAEASPSEFLGAVEKLLNVENSPIKALFEEDPGIISPISYHTGLLWALENVAWLPEYFSRTALILTKLSIIDPGGTLSNRPFNSLRNLFIPQLYQTLAPFKTRMKVLEMLANKETNLTWDLLIEIMPNSYSGIIHYSSNMRWRKFDQNLNEPKTYKEIFETHSKVIDILISIFDYSETKLSQLIELSTNLRSDDRNNILKFINSNLGKIKQDEYKAWNTLRKLLYKHKSLPDAKWSMSFSDLKPYELLYKALTPSDEIAKSKWLFDEHWPEFPEGFIRRKDSLVKQQKIIFKRRLTNLNEIYTKYGINRVKELSLHVKESAILGSTISKIVNKDDEILSICDFLNNKSKDLIFVQSFISDKSRLHGIEWVYKLFYLLEKKGFNNYALAQLFVPIEQTVKLWEFIDSTNNEIINKYWTNCYAGFYNLSPKDKEVGLKYLIKFDRYSSAIQICSHEVKDISSPLLIEILEKVVTIKSNEDIRPNRYEINNLFEELEKREDIKETELIKLEWNYLPILTSYGNIQKPKHLHNELSNNPESFIEIIKWIYKPKNNKELEKEEIEELSEEQLLNRAKLAHDLLDTWKKIPGSSESKIIDFKFLKKWITKARKLAKKFDRVDVADCQIGKILAQYPQNDEDWPPDEICEIIENINSDCLNNNFSVAIFNKRGFTTRGPYEGGDQEREMVEKYNNFAKRKAESYPTVSSILLNIARSYISQAKEEDREAEIAELEH
ncbi:MAG: hypothetical protein KAU01_08360 [Candidatus Cloacimonetes bacterium]|nr:hypothetical protein [Candidatus Cloacimonadota bacterium]